MSSSRSNSSSYSNVSANNLYEVEDELKGSEKSDDEDNANSDNDNSDIEAYFDEPMADEAWLADYLRRREEDEERQQQLQLRLNGNEPVTSW